MTHAAEAFRGSARPEAAQQSAAAEGAERSRPDLVEPHRKAATPPRRTLQQLGRDIVSDALRDADAWVATFDTCESGE